MIWPENEERKGVIIRDIFRKRNGRRGLSYVLLSAVLIWLAAGSTEAAGFYENSRVSLSPDGSAWTIVQELPKPSDATNRINPSCWYPMGESVETGVKSTKKDLKIGEHYYQYDRRGEVPVGKWSVAFSAAKCIHPCLPGEMGLSYPLGYCRSSYYSGWNPFCADCGERIDTGNIYISRECAGSLKSIDLSRRYYYQCPTCKHLDQVRVLSHRCVAVSANRYRVVYMPNAVKAEGYMQPSFHMYNNAEEFEGEIVRASRRLSANCYRRKGYCFVGWNTKADGSGRSFTDEQEILNLVSENFQEETGKGSVTLYAQWKAVTGILQIDAGEGTYCGKKGNTEVKVGYGDAYGLLENQIIPPMGFRVSFDSMGGEPVASSFGVMRFSNWRFEEPLHGSVEGSNYIFFGKDDERDVVHIVYEPVGVILPEAKREGYSFGGWYLDRACTDPVGQAGDLFTPVKSVTLYANWVELVLRAEPKPQGNNWKGTTDLFWSQPDSKQKMYMLYQRAEGEDYIPLQSFSGETMTAKKEPFQYSGAPVKYEVLQSGFYRLSAYGSQGTDEESQKGGLGGMTEGVFFLQKGDVLTVRVGGKDGYNYGGKGVLFGSGGGRTEIVSKQSGILMIAGGGGGATMGSVGGHGGLEASTFPEGNGRGQSGSSGGGGGLVGGSCGEYSVHIHDDSCLHTHKGNPREGGECYTRVSGTKECTLSVFEAEKDNRKRTDCSHCKSLGRDGTGTMVAWAWTIVHGQCGSAPDYSSHGWWQCEVCGTVGYVWGSGRGRPVVRSHSYTQSYYILNCDRKYDCNPPEDRVIASSGGTSYIQTALATAYRKEAGVREGDGYALIEPVTVGFSDDRKALDISTPDLVAPEKLQKDRIITEGLADGAVKIRFEMPEDRGSNYNHYVESYSVGSASKLCTSNVTLSRIVSGTRGIYYVLNDKAEYKVTAKNANNRGNILTQEELVLPAGQDRRYLHLAAVDRAGNVGESIDLNLEQIWITIPWTPETTPLKISSIVGECDYENVAFCENNKFYVRADGRTPFSLEFNGCVPPYSNPGYQVDELSFRFTRQNSDATGEYAALIPRSSLVEDEVFWADAIGCRSEGNGILQAAMFAWAKRCDKQKTTMLKKAFTLGAGYNGVSLTVVPGAGAEWNGKRVYSDSWMDQPHALTLIGDGEAPVLSGLKVLEQNLYNNLEEENVVVDLSARDELSGVRDFFVYLLNRDTYMEKTWYPEADGHIRFTLGKETDFALGDVLIRIVAVDRVGNRVEKEYGAVDFGLRAQIVGKLHPETNQLKRGETAVITIWAKGFADRIEVSFAKEFTDQTTEEVNRLFSYNVPMEQVEESYEFMIPLGLEKDQEFPVTVRAYKGDMVLEEHPVFCTFRVIETVLGEFRTRLR